MKQAFLRFGTASLLLVLACSFLPAQVDFLLADTASSGSTYPDSVTLIEPSGAMRPLARHPATGTTTAFTASVISSPIHLNLGGVDYLYWFDNISDRFIRGTDANGNGVVDPTEFEVVFDRVVDMDPLNTSPDTVRHANGKFYFSNDSGTNTRGVWIFEDLTGDFDFNDPGEISEIINGFTGSSGSTITVGGVTTSSDDIEMADALSDGDVIWACDDDKVVYRWDSATMTNSVYLNYDPAYSAAGTALPANPDFVGLLLPTPGSVSGTAEDLDRITVDLATDAVYLAVNFEDDEPWIYKCVDLNADGDANDAGEVTLFWDGSTEVTLVKPATDDLIWFNGSVYVSIEDDPGGGASQGKFLQLTDLNGDGDANDAGEFVLQGTMAVGDDPTVLGFSVVPSGTFVPTCVAFSIDDSGIDQLASTLTFTFADIPAAAQTGTEVGAVALSLSGSGGTLLGPTCVIGLDFDFFSNIFLLPFLFNSLITPPVMGSPATTPGLALPAAAFPAGLDIYYAAALLGPNAGTTGILVSQSRVLTVQ